jgi:hypothetical protein
MARDARPSSGALESASDRPLGFWMCTALVIGNTMGMGIFLLTAAPNQKWVADFSVPQQAA